jgi:uncharacterized protein (TIGR02246 family)
MKPFHFFALVCLTLQLTLPASAQERQLDDNAIRNIVATMESGWNAKSGKEFSTYFAANHDYIVWSGIYLANIPTETNAMAHQGLFDGMYKNVDLELRLDKIRYIKDDVAVVHVLGATYDQGTPIPELPKVIITLVVEKKDSQWQIISFHNCDIEPAFPNSDPKAAGPPPHIMFASWNRSEQ